MDLEISWADRIYGVRDVLAINNDQVLILAGGVTYDSIYKEEAFVHWVYRYDLKDRKALWRRNYGHPPSSIITPGCRVVASQRDEDTWLMCTSAVLAGSTREHYVIAGRVAKFTAYGDTLWAKDYVLYKDEHLDRNRFVTMIPTMDGNYLLGGFLSWGRMQELVSKDRRRWQYRIPRYYLLSGRLCP
ncbi:MAG: hypothetical protein IPM26_04155 [Saprospiraceae bacterium]|nr:hypothetical protein [Saprospiraceae bacterium]